MPQSPPPGSLALRAAHGWAVSAPPRDLGWLISLGRKHRLHVGSPKAAPSVAAIISVVESWKRIGVNAHDSLRRVLAPLAMAVLDQVATPATTLTPQKWKSQLPAASNIDTVC